MKCFSSGPHFLYYGTPEIALGQLKIFWPGSSLSTGGHLLVAKKVRYEKCLCCRITTAMYAVQSLYILALSVMIIATYTAYGFTINAIPNLTFLIGLAILLFLFRVYVWFRDNGEISDLCLSIISNSLIMIIYVFALIVSVRWRKYMIGLKKVKFG
ncbi:hypothetical protein LOAG_03760 [Loa loa]|uniref:Uncharacterized protein n=1 Tax=Loa loa TaxID=7209 RepID=A0A1S0U3N8_LOALO|nr:hypothetical protein LOAG_03760 [Loa loa]EFO24725.1 hypothetical protein LOAG_03760 [Loa loa]